MEPAALNLVDLTVSFETLLKAIFIPFGLHLGARNLPTYLLYAMHCKCIFRFSTHIRYC